MSASQPAMQIARDIRRRMVMATGGRQIDMDKPTAAVVY